MSAIEYHPCPKCVDKFINYCPSVAESARALFWVSVAFSVVALVMIAIFQAVNIGVNPTQAAAPLSAWHWQTHLFYWSNGATSLIMAGVAGFFFWVDRRYRYLEQQKESNLAPENKV